MKSLAQRLFVLALGVSLLLLVPLVAMQFTDEVAWSLTDFATAAVLLFGAGLTYLTVTQNTPSRRLAVAAAVLVVLVLVWAELAVGVFGTPWAGS
jgi:hypothetical protein